MTVTIATLVEAFAAASNPQLPETPQQSRVRGAQDVAKARAEIRWDESKHPRGRGGKFGSKGGARSRGASRRARKGSPGQGNTLTVGTRGALVGAVQRQLGITADGVYGPQTRGAVERFQQQHGIQVDGIVGAQTLAALRGQGASAPGPIRVRQARVVKPRVKKAAPVKPGAPVRQQGGVVV